MIKFSAATAVAVAALFAQAHAADLPLRGAAIAPAPVFVGMNWSGFYIGAQAGYAWGSGNTCQSIFGVPIFPGCTSSGLDGVVGGLHAGYNIQSGAFVYGLEADVEATGKTARTPNGIAPPITSIGYKSDWQGSLRARVGYAFNRTLLYATGGVAFGNYQNSYNFTGLGTVFKSSDVRVGWTLGAGLEYAFSNNWTARVEYRYTDWGSETEAPPALAVGFNPFSYRHATRDHTVRIGLTYLFSSAAPGAVVAKY